MVLNLFERRKARVITAVRKTNPYKATDGIDQEEMKETMDWAKQSYKQQNIKFSVLVYVYDITWIAANKFMLREITEIASKFFELNDIQINRKKSKLVILNTSLWKEESQVFFGSKIVKAENIATTTRFLGV
ncbi:25734_t:CDS:2 [Gigaspora margarita]|uniref:25734_t:CDS:1 n=1 Tax=Gigaspora margarita TaxID=4874 RepID=A0ABN7WFN4_GIGMA|nr:25734_t:CDS:2 [Gigaspora margarita]